MGDIIDCIYILFDGGDHFSFIVREHPKPLVHSLCDHYSQLDMSVDTFEQNFKEASLSLEEISLSLDCVLLFFLGYFGLSSSIV